MVKKVIDSPAKFANSECIHLNKNYGCKKLTHDEYRDRIVKYLLGEGLKNYKIPLPPVLNKKIGKHNTGENDKDTFV